MAQIAILVEKIEKYVIFTKKPTSQSIKKSAALRLLKKRKLRIESNTYLFFGIFKNRHFLEYFSILVIGTIQ